jgi:hypothetical protein
VIDDVSVDRAFNRFQLEAELILQRGVGVGRRIRIGDGALGRPVHRKVVARGKAGTVFDN